MTYKAKRALKWIISLLRENNVPFQVTGGFAAKIYGSNRKLNDIDIEIKHSRDLEKIKHRTKEYIVYGPKRYKDNQWDLTLMTLKYKGQLIDICGSGTTKIKDRKTGKWMTIKDKKRPLLKTYWGLRFPLESKEDIIRYKSMIGRKCDRIDVKNLSKN